MRFKRPQASTIAVSGVLAFMLATHPLVADAAGMITGRDIKNGSVTTKDIRNGNLLAKDFKAGQLPEGPAGPAGPEGPAGPKGDTGPQGVPGISGLEMVQTPKEVPASTKTSLAGSCPPGKKLISATAYWSSSNQAVQVVYATSFSARAYTEGVPAQDRLNLQLHCALVQ